jgi:cytochrome P450
MAWAIYLLSTFEDVRARMEAEIDAADLDGAPPETWPARLPFAEAVVKESMRLYPAGSVISRVAIAPDRLGDQDVAPGTTVMTSTWVLHRHRTIWRDPDSFDPLRFLGEEGASIPRFAYLPFGLGPRVCIGASFAMQEMVIILAALYSRLRLSFAERDEPRPIQKLTLRSSSEIAARIELRH